MFSFSKRLTHNSKGRFKITACLWNWFKLFQQFAETFRINRLTPTPPRANKTLQNSCLSRELTIVAWVQALHHYSHKLYCYHLHQPRVICVDEGHHVFLKCLEVLVVGRKTKCLKAYAWLVGCHESLPLWGYW